jgi:hypothetical protein
MCRIARTVGMGLGLLLAASGASAGDGAIEINGVAAAAGGVTPGDAPGFPVSLSRPGRYVLTGDLELGSPGTTAIELLADGITLDLNDFTIRGVVACTAGSPTSCTPSGSGVGIVGAAAYSVVRRGRVLGMGNDCIRLGTAARVEGLLVAECGDEGVEVGLFADVRDTTSIDVAGDGIVVGGSARVRDSQAFGSGGFGIRTTSHAIVAGNQVAANGSGGLWVVDGVVRENSVVGNGGSGVLVEGSAVVLGNLVGNNGGNGVAGLVGGRADSVVVAQNALVGNEFTGASSVNDLLAVQNLIARNQGGVACAEIPGVADTCVVLENAILANEGLGISGPSLHPISSNVISGNGVDATGAGLLEFGTNVCGPDTTCP